MKVINEIKTLLGMEVKLATMKLEDGITTIEAEEFAPEFAVFIVTEEDAIPMPIGEFVLEDSRILVVAQEGIISEIKDAEQPAEETPEEDAPVVEEEMSNEVATPKRIVESVSKEMFFEEIEKLRAEIETLKSAKAEDVTIGDKVEMSAEVPVLTHNPDATTKTNMIQFSSKRQSTTLDRVFSKLNNN